MTEYAPRERVLAALDGELLDRPAMTLWRHWPVDDQEVAAFARVTAEHQAALSLDVVKVTPSASFMSEAWGARTVYQGDPMGVRAYRSRPVRTAQDWAGVTVLDVAESPTLQREVDAVRAVRVLVDADVPVLATVFTPLSVVRYLCGEEVFLAHLRTRPEVVTRAMRAIAATTRALVRCMLDAGADGVYFSLFPASHTLVSEAEYREVALPFDQEVMSAAEDAPIRVAHFHLPFPLLRVARDLPANVVSWEHADGGPSLSDGMALTGTTVMGGLDQNGALARGTSAAVAAETRGAALLAQSPQTRGIVLATSCSYPLTAPQGNVLSFCDTVRGMAPG